jgi:hypothetical protein
MTRRHFEEHPPIVLCRNDPNEWRNAARALKDDPNARRELGRKSYEFVQERHSLKMTVSQILHFAVDVLRNAEGKKWVEDSYSPLSQEVA